MSGPDATGSYKYLLHFHHRYCPDWPGVRWLFPDNRVQAHPCIACGEPVMPHKTEDLRRIRGVRLTGSLKSQQGDNALAKYASIEPTKPTKPTD